MNAANQELGARIVELAHQRRRFGYRRIHDLLSREHHKGRTVVDYAVAEGTQTVSIIGVFYGGRHHGRALSAAYDEPGWLVVAGDERARHVRVDHLAVQAGG